MGYSSGGGSGTIFSILTSVSLRLPSPAVKQEGGSCARVDRPRTLKLGAHEGAPRTATIALARVSVIEAACQSRSLNWQRPGETRGRFGALQWRNGGGSMFGKWTTGNKEKLIGRIRWKGGGVILSTDICLELSRASAYYRRNFAHKKAPLILISGAFHVWRRDRDLNPRYCCQYNGFRIRPVRPLRHLSSGAHHTSVFVSGKPFSKKIRVVSGACVSVRVTAARPGAWRLLRRLR